MNKRTPLCDSHRAEWMTWLDYPMSSSPGVVTSGAAYDDTAAGSRDRRRIRFEHWRRMIREQQARVVEACANECHVVAERSLNVLSLFSGIGGLELGLERAGMTVVGQVEIDPFCQRVLAKHWPEVPRHDNVRTAVDWWGSAVRPAVDVVVGGFPCQPFSDAGRRRGTADDRWGWPWMADVIRHVRPSYVVVEKRARACSRRRSFRVDAR